MILPPIAVFIASICASTSGKHIGAKMGVLNEECDNAQNRLDVDWPGFSKKTHTCTVEGGYEENADIESTTYTIPGLKPEDDLVIHKCMNETIAYSRSPPLRGDHRPNWAVYGEYVYLPEQRWLHNLEHGSVIMMYHPCAPQRQVDKLRAVVNACLWRHIITPYTGLTKERPLALVTWANKLEMNTVDEDKVRQFIKTHARKAPEDLSKQGQYTFALVEKARIVSDQDDNDICPDDQ